MFGRIESDLLLEDESQRFDGKIVFKEKMMIFILMNTLEILRDITIIIPKDDSI